MTLDKIIQGLKAVRTIHNGNYSTQIDSAIHIFKHLKTELELCEDCISRSAVLDILKDKWNIFSNANDAMQESIDTIEALPSVIPSYNSIKTELEPCVDCVNRLDVLAILLNAYNESRFDGYTDYCAVSDLVADLPSIKIGG